MRFLSPPLTKRLISTGLSLTALVLLGGIQPASGQNQKNTLQIDSDQVLEHLNHVITWYRHTKTQVQPVGLPTDALYQGKADDLAIAAAQSAFDSAYKIAPLIPNDAQQTSASTSLQNLVKLRADTSAQNAQLTQQINTLNGQVANASKKNLQALTDQRDRLQGELDLGKSRLNALDQLVNSVSVNRKGQKGQQNSPTSFQGSIEQLKSTIPELSDKSKTTIPASTPAGASSGLISQLKRLYDQSVSLHQIDSLLVETNQLEDFVNGMRTPLSADIKATVQQGRDLAAAADNAQPGQPAPTKQDFDALAAKLDQLAGITIPLSQEVAMLEASKANLADWRDSISGQYGSILHSILTRVAIILGALGILFLLSDLWKRATFRYISDVRRRRQFLMIRRFVMGFCMGLVFILGFVSEFSALATFAGFITAGLAVGLQTILLSVAAYFFFSGRYGLRVGDRVSIAGVTGDVADVGLVRFYLLELAGTGVDLQPTGRIVTFPNSQLFQTGSPMFRQVPGTNYTWREAAITLTPGGDHRLVEESMLSAVNQVYEKYRPTLERQHSDIERRFEIPFSPLKPKVQLQLSDAGLEAVVRYPVSLHDGIEADDQITRSLIDTIGKNEQLKAAVSGLPKIRSSVRS
jgi:small-conductance mechanosensitive channel